MESKNPARIQEWHTRNAGHRPIRSPVPGSGRRGKNQGSMNLENPGSEHGEESKKFNELLQGESSLAKEIQKKSRGQITEGTAKRLVSDLKKKQKSPTAASKTGR
ncbi:MAG: hypothetical protein CMF59_15650 [Leptospiraceae bacterium]|nr:hypothetical protein [Leptospiraceae bacterium]